MRGEECTGFGECGRHAPKLTLADRERRSRAWIAVSLQHAQVTCFGAGYRLHRNAAIECDQASAVANRKRQQVGIGGLAVAQYAAPFHGSSFQQVDIVRPERMGVSVRQDSSVAT